MDFIVQGIKTGFAKHDSGFWQDVKNGDLISLTNGVNEIEIVVRAKKTFSSYGDAWFSYKTVNGRHPVFPQLDNLDVVTINDVNNYFSQNEFKVNDIVIIEFEKQSELRKFIC